MTGSSVTSADVRRAYTPDKAWDERHNQWVVFFLVRPLTQRLAPLLVRAGISADTVTLAGLIVSLLLPALAWLPPSSASISVAAASLLFLILDCLDGDVARGSGKASRRGGHLDMVSDLIHRLLLYVAIGFLAAGRGGTEYAPLFGAFSAWLALASRWCRMSLAEKDNHDVYAQHQRERLAPSDYAFFFFAGIDQLLPAFIVVAAAGDGMTWLVVAVLVYSALDFGVTQVLAWRALK